MTSVILSLKPKYAEAIFSGKKRCEFRKVPFSKDVDFSIVYASSPISRLVGWFVIDEMDMGHPETIWRRSSRVSGISHDEFRKYYGTSDIAVCLRISDAHRFSYPINPEEKRGGFVVPQSFRYVTRDDVQFLASRVGRLPFLKIGQTHSDR